MPPEQKSDTWLLAHKTDTNSQFGEDGVIAKILETLPQNDKWCAEFGAWDGLFLSNTRNLIENHDYSAVMIEGNPIKCDELKENYSENKKVTGINQFVGFLPNDNLDHILEKTAIPMDFDFLSIDIDGNDYHVWKAFTKYKPKCICIEFNATIPSEVEFIQEANPSTQQGSSVLAMVNLGKEKGYSLVCIIETNAIFVRNEYFDAFAIADNSIRRLRTDLSPITYMFCGYDGTVFLRGARQLNWHGLELKEKRYQRIPKFLRQFPGSYSRFRMIMFGLYLLFTSPKTLAKMIRRLDIELLPKQYGFLRVLARWLKKFCGDNSKCDQPKGPLQN